MISLNLLPSSNLSLSKSLPTLRRNPISRFPPIPKLGFPHSPQFHHQILKSIIPFPKPLKSSPPSASASSDSTPSEEIQPIPKPNNNLKLAIVFGLWYTHNIIFNIYNKKALNVFPYPWLLASFQLFCGSIWVFFLWAFKIQPCPKINKSFIIALLGHALFHTNVSLSKVVVLHPRHQIR